MLAFRFNRNDQQAAKKVASRASSPEYHIQATRLRLHAADFVLPFPIISLVLNCRLSKVLFFLFNTVPSNYCLAKSLFISRYSFSQSLSILSSGPCERDPLTQSIQHLQA